MGRTLARSLLNWTIPTCRIWNKWMNEASCGRLFSFFHFLLRVFDTKVNWITNNTPCLHEMDERRFANEPSSLSSLSSLSSSRFQHHHYHQIDEDRLTHHLSIYPSVTRGWMDANIILLGTWNPATDCLWLPLIDINMDGRYFTRPPACLPSPSDRPTAILHVSFVLWPFSFHSC